MNVSNGLCLCRHGAAAAGQGLSDAAGREFEELLRERAERRQKEPVRWAGGWGRALREGGMEGGGGGGGLSAGAIVGAWPETQPSGSSGHAEGHTEAGRRC